MTKLFRIYTEDKNRALVEGIMADQFDNFTVIEAAGYYNGTKEKSLILEVISEDPLARYTVNYVARAIRDANQQECVLVTEQTLDNMKLV